MFEINKIVTSCSVPVFSSQQPIFKARSHREPRMKTDLKLKGISTQLHNHFEVAA